MGQSEYRKACGVCRDGGQSQRDGKGVGPIETGILDSLQSGDHP